MQYGGLFDGGDVLGVGYDVVLGGASSAVYGGVKRGRDAFGFVGDDVFGEGVDLFGRRVRARVVVDEVPRDDARDGVSFDDGDVVMGEEGFPSFAVGASPLSESSAPLSDDGGGGVVGATSPSSPSSSSSSSASSPLSSSSSDEGDVMPPLAVSMTGATTAAAMMMMMASPASAMRSSLHSSLHSSSQSPSTAHAFDGVRLCRVLAELSLDDETRSALAVASLDGLREMRSRDFVFVHRFLQAARRPGTAVDAVVTRRPPTPSAGAFYAYTEPVERGDSLSWRTRKQSVKLIVFNAARRQYKLKNSKRDCGRVVMRRRTWIGEGADAAWRKHEYRVVRTDTPAYGGEAGEARVELAELPVLVHYFRKEGAAAATAAAVAVAKATTTATKAFTSPTVSPMSSPPVSPVPSMPEWVPAAMPPSTQAPMQMLRTNAAPPIDVRVQTYAPQRVRAGERALVLVVLSGEVAEQAEHVIVVRGQARIEPTTVTKNVIQFEMPRGESGSSRLFAVETTVGRMRSTTGWCTITFA